MSRNAPTSSTHDRLGGRVLVCDDSPTLRRLIIEMLGNQFEYVEASSAEEALLLLEHRAPDLIIADVVMGEMDGYELCARVRSRPETSAIPFILVTGSQDDSRVQALERGADDYLTKPVCERELSARVTALMRLRRATLALKARTAELDQSKRALQEAQLALAQSERLATVGTLAAGVAHEVNNPLAYMKAGLSVIRSRVAEIESQIRSLGGVQPQCREELADSFAEIREVETEVEEGVRRIQRIVADLKDFASDRKDELEEVDLAEEVHRAWKVASMRGERSPQLEVQLEEGTCLTTVRHRFGQVLLNLFVNAVQAMAGMPGKVMVSARADESHLHIAISDTGPGIPAHVLDRVFDPFFTTKPPNLGTGLGLSVSFGIMRSLGGDITVESTEGQGATFTLRLPHQPPEPKAEPTLLAAAPQSP